MSLGIRMLYNVVTTLMIICSIVSGVALIMYIIQRFFKSKKLKRSAETLTYDLKGLRIPMPESCERIPLYSRIVQRTFSIILSAIGIIVLFPIYTFIIFYKIWRGQEVFSFRVIHGYMGKKIKLVKFSANTNEYLGVFLKKTSIEYLPRIYNILVGDLNVVGLKTYTTQFEIKYQRELECIRQMCRPGLLSMYNVYKYKFKIPDISEETLDYDYEYLSDHNLRKDFLIFKYTLIHVFTEEWMIKYTIARK